MPKHSTSLRDAALRRLGRLNRWLIAGSVVMTAVFADIAANAFPGKTLKTTGASKGNAHNGSAAKTSTQVVKPPVRPPTATPEDGAQAAESPSSSEPAPSESTPAQESTPSQESAPAQESAPPPAEPAPAQETAPTPAPAEQQAPPVVSGGS